MNIKDKILQKIKSDKIRPISKWHFEAVNFAWWALFGLLFILGSIAFSVVVYLIMGMDWEIAQRSITSWTEQLVLLLPYFWLVLIVVAVIVSIWNFRQTKTGYRYSSFIILGTVLIGSMVLGSVIYASGFSEKLDNLFTDNLSFYRGRMHQQIDVWNKVEQGFLIGRIRSFNEEMEHILLLQAPQGEEWIVDYSNVPKIIHPLLEIEQVVRILGEKIDGQNFKALDIRPLPINRFFEPPQGRARPEMRFFNKPNLPPPEFRNFERY